MQIGRGYAVLVLMLSAMYLVYEGTFSLANLNLHTVLGAVCIIFLFGIHSTAAVL